MHARWPIFFFSLGVTALASSPPPEFVSLADIAPEIRVEMRYAGADNFLGRKVKGYHANKCLLTRAAAEALARAQSEAKTQKQRLVVYDCYRPQRAVDDFLRWAADTKDTKTRAAYYPNVPKDKLVPDYIADKSGHSRGSTVDISFVGVDMGTKFDLFDPLSNTAAKGIRDTARKNRQRLKALLENHGFKNYEMEWWHYTLRNEPYPDRRFDVPVE